MGKHDRKIILKNVRMRAYFLKDNFISYFIMYDYKAGQGFDNGLEGRVKIQKLIKSVKKNMN